jgi:hypothetical protein
MLTSEKNRTLNTSGRLFGKKEVFYQSHWSLIGLFNIKLMQLTQKMVELVIELRPFPSLMSHALIDALDQGQSGQVTVLSVVINHWSLSVISTLPDQYARVALLGLIATLKYLQRQAGIRFHNTIHWRHITDNHHINPLTQTIPFNVD